MKIIEHFEKTGWTDSYYMGKFQTRIYPFIEQADDENKPISDDEDDLPGCIIVSEKTGWVEIFFDTETFFDTYWRHPEIEKLANALTKAAELSKQYNKEE